ncbi:MAG: MFS transporter [Agathobacter sp.]|nr:MFS transporter [Agathobacter sp.]
MSQKNPKMLSLKFFDHKFMDSKVKTEYVSKSEKYLGHLIGPLGLIFVVNTIAALVEKFFTQQVGAMYGVVNVEMVQEMGLQYEFVMTLAKVLAVGMGLLNSWLISHSKSKQGRFRPWHLIFGFISIIVAMLIFLFPGTTLGESYWYYFFVLLISYHTVGSLYFYLFRDNIVSISTRDAKEKEQLTFIRKMSWTLISGIIIGMLVSSVAIPFWLEKDINSYAYLMIILSVVAIPLLLLEYFFTRERVIEEVAETNEEINNIPLKEQFKALFTNKYWLILTFLVLLQGIVDHFKGGNVQYFYIKFMLDGANNGFMYTIYQIVTGVPLGIGAFAIYPIARKVGIKNMTIGGYTLVLIGSVIGWMFPDQLIPAMVGGFLRNLGWLPNAYIFATLMCYAFDSVEYKSGVRLEGLMAMGIITAVMTLIYAPFAGGFESAILQMGFVDMEGVIASQAVKDFMTLSFYLFDIILAVAFIILLPFVDVEKKMPEITMELKRRKEAHNVASNNEE